MNVQVIIVAILFAVAVLYIGRMVYKNLFVKKGCSSNCKCGVGFSDIDTQKK